MKYEVRTYQGLIVTLGEEFNPETYLETINNERIESVAFGNVSTMKHNIRTITPVYEEADVPVGDPVLIYTTQSQEPIVAHVEDFNAGEITKKVNERVSFLKIGDTIINRNDYSLVMPQQ